MNNRRVTLHISLAPSDYKHSVHLLPHQIDVFGDQVDEILFTYETHKSKGRFGTEWEANNDKMWLFLESLRSRNNKIRILKNDYSKQKVKEIANRFFSQNSIPPKDWRGGPFYTYFFGLNEAVNNLVMHIDSDLFFGGLSKTWINEAIEYYHGDKTILFINPLAGPPRQDQALTGQNYASYKNLPYSYLFNTMSTRLFFVGRDRLLEHKIKNIRTYKFGELIRGFYKKNPLFKLPEHFLTDHMHKHGLIRVDFKGTDNGLWSLHPPYRTPEFYVQLPNIIQRVVSNDLPDSQRGFYDIVDDLFDWSAARKKTGV